MARNTEIKARIDKLDNLARRAEARDLMRRMGGAPEQLVDGEYLDLLAGIHA